MIRKLSILILSAMAALPAYSQTLVWKNFSSMYDMTGITVAGGKVWAATKGGVFSYSPQSGEFNEYTTTEGLSNIQATAIAREPSGRILVGESSGAIDELDSAGHVLRSQLDIANSAEINKAITSILVEGDTAFASTPFGVVLISLSTFRVLDTYSHFNPAQASVQANDVAVFNGNIYVACGAGLAFAPRSAINLAAPNLWQLTDTLGMSSGVTSLANFDGTLVVGTPSGLLYTDDGTTFSAVPGAPTGAVSSLTPESNYLLVSSASGLYKMSAVSMTFSTMYSGGTVVSGAVSYSDTLIFGSTGNGMLAVGNSTSMIYPPGPATNTISSLAVDASGNLWCATNNTTNPNVAFMEFNGSKWINYNISNFPQLQSNQGIYRVSALSDNRLIIGTWGNGMVMIKGDSTATHFDNTNSTLVGSNTVKYVIVGNAALDQSGNIWMTNPLAYNGNNLAVYSPKDSTWHSFHNGLAQSAGYSPVAIDAYGGVWTGDGFGQASGTGFGGLYYYNDNGTLNNLSDDQSYIFNQNDSPILSDRVNSVVVDNEDQVWVGTDLGLDVIYDPDPAAGFGFQSIYSMLDQYVNDIACDGLDQKWVATKTGVYELSRDGNTTIASYNMTNSPLPSDLVSSIACDKKNGIIYMATEYGITELKTGVTLPTQSFSKLKVYPDPAFLPLSRPIHIEGLVANSEIKIFAVDGRLVDQFQAQGGNIAYWYGTDSLGKNLPSGVYIVVAYSADGSQSSVSKIALIRR